MCWYVTEIYIRHYYGDASLKYSNVQAEFDASGDASLKYNDNLEFSHNDWKIYKVH